MANLQGNGIPSTSTVGNVDDIYVDTITNLKYKLIRIENREYYKQLEQDYIWELLPPWEQNSSNGSDGKDGGYYTPSVDTSGNLTWTGSKEGMTAVPSVNIKGPQGAPGSAADAVMVVTLTGTTSSHSSTEIYNALKAGKMVYGIATLQSGDLGETSDNYTGERVCYPSYPFGSDKVTFFTIGEVEANIGGKLGYLILYVSGTTVSVHDEGTIRNLEPDAPETV